MGANQRRLVSGQQTLAPIGNSMAGNLIQSGNAQAAGINGAAAAVEQRH
jgi:hypothetical protein